MRSRRYPPPTWTDRAVGLVTLVVGAGGIIMGLNKLRRTLRRFLRVTFGDVSSANRTNGHTAQRGPRRCCNLSAGRALFPPAQPTVPTFACVSLCVVRVARWGGVGNRSESYNSKPSS